MSELPAREGSSGLAFSSSLISRSSLAGMRGKRVEKYRVSCTEQKRKHGPCHECGVGARPCTGARQLLYRRACPLCHKHTRAAPGPQKQYLEDVADVPRHGHSVIRASHADGNLLVVLQVVVEPRHDVRRDAVAEVEEPNAANVPAVSAQRHVFVTKRRFCDEAAAALGARVRSRCPTAPQCGAQQQKLLQACRAASSRRILTGNRRG